MTRDKMQLPLIVLLLYLLLLPVTGMVPILRELTGGRYPDLSEFQQHLFMSANMLGALLFAPVIGLLSDAWKLRKPLILIALIINGLAVWMLLLDWSYPIFLGWRFIEGCAHISALSLLMAMASEQGQQQTGRRKVMGGIMGLVGAAISLGVATGAPLGGLLGRTGADSVLLAGGGLLLLLVPLAALGLRERPGGHAGSGLSALLRALPQNLPLRLPYAFAFVDRLTVGVIVSTLSLYLSSQLGLDALQIGLIMALFLLPFSLLTYPAGLLSRRWNPVRMMFIGSIAYGLTLATLGLATPGQIPWLMFAGGVVASLMYAPSLVLVASLSRPEHRAMAMGGFNLAGSLGFVLGPLTGGGLVALFSAWQLPAYPLTFVLVGLLELLCVALFVPWARRHAEQLRLDA
ncbi:MAG: MFS transporter [Gammaproteobacteria bacterium SHHR-1]|uniref:MFS transporter n=1 Tax=Magnetovirga frankeli TaxID=947516 RepID=UPI00129388CB|nr:MFS transporter [gamma proteobacterium SS-5]